MAYEINISKDGKHYFATHPRSLRDKRDAQRCARKLQKAFTEAEGYRVTLRRSITQYEHVEL